MKGVRLAILALLALVLAAAPVLVGCGEEATPGTVVVGVLTDFSGPAAFAVVPTVETCREAFDYLQEKDPIPGLTVNWVEYDTRLDYSKSVEGYQDLKGRGMQVIYAMCYQDRANLQTYFAQDKIPCLAGAGADEDLLEHQWVFATSITQTMQGEVMMRWIADTWDYAGKGRPPVVGHQGWSLATTNKIQTGLDKILNSPQYSGKFTWAGMDKATLTNVDWTTSYQKFKDCDFVVVTPIGNSLATFPAQMRSLGYKGALISTMDGFSGYWSLVQNKATADQLYDCYYPWWGPMTGSEQNTADWYQTMVEVTQANHPGDWQARVSTTAPMTGWLTAESLHEGLRNAVKEVGADKLDGDALQAGFAAINLDLEQTGGTLAYTGGINVGLREAQMLEWDVATSQWKTTNNKWYLPLELEE